MPKNKTIRSGWDGIMREAWARMPDKERVEFLVEQTDFLKNLLDEDERAAALILAIQGKAA